MPAAGSRKTIMLIDGYGLIFRAYFAIDTAMTTAAGEQTNAVFGYARMLLDVLNNQKPDYAIVALDAGKTFRHDEYDGYKATRAAMPDDLKGQIHRVEELTRTMNLPMETLEGYEADDIIGSLSKRCAHELGLHVLIVTGDSDLLQLADDCVDVVLPGRPRFQDLRFFNRDTVIDRYGFAPEFIPDFKALVGDTSDNIPGVPGVGEKTATALITKWGDVEQIIAHAGEITPPRAQKAISAGIDTLRMSKRLATIVRDLDVHADLAHAAVDNYDRDAMVELFRTLEFRSLVAKLPVAQEDAAVAPMPLEERPPSVRTIVNTVADLDRLVARVRETGSLALDVESTALDPMLADLVGIAIAVSATESFYAPVSHDGWSKVSPELIRSKLQPILNNPEIKIVTHHGKYDIQVLRTAGYQVGKVDFDTMIAAYLLGENSVGLKDLAFTKLGIQMTEISELIGAGKNQLSMNLVDADTAGDYACGDVEATFALMELFAPLLGENDQEALFHEIEMPLIPVLAEMERTGVAIDEEYLHHLSEEIRTRMGGLEREIHELARRPINIGSNKQLATLLFDEFKLTSGRKTKTGFSVDADVLEGIKGEHPIVEKILEFKSLTKLESTYVSSLPSQVNPRTGRIHTSYNQTIAATGRLSSVNPNLQNIPIRTELGRRVRRAFIADHRPDRELFADAVFVSADYSQIELRLMAHLSGEPFLVDSFKTGADIHRATASLVYGVSQEEVTPDMRRVAKTVNFGLLYGMQAFGLSRDSGLSRADAQKFIDQYWARLPNVKRFFDETINFGVKHGYVETLHKRRRAVSDLTSTNGMRRMSAERVAMNMPVQGTAADIMKIAMLRLAESLNDSGRKAKLLLQVHDELVLEVDRPDVPAVAKIVRDAMEGAQELSVPLLVEIAAGPNWDEMTELS